MPKRKSKKTSTSRERFERIYQSILEKICLLEYTPGTRLSEDELADEYGVSRTPIRRVLSRLETEGLVESRHGVGTIVTDVDIDSLLEVYQFRLELAALMGRLAPNPRQEKDIQNLRDLLDRCYALEQAPDLTEFARLNLDFYEELTSMVGNPLLKETINRLFFLTTRIWLSLTQESLPHEVRIFRREMEDILAAMEEADLLTVGYIHRTHISMSYNRLKRYAENHKQTV